MTQDELLRQIEVAAMFGVSTRTIHRYAEAGILPSIILPSGHRRFRRSEVLRVLGQPPIEDKEPTND